MYYVDSQQTITRRDSSLIVPRRTHRDFDAPSTARIESTPRLSDSGSTTSAPSKPKGSTRNELITQLFESMLYNIVESWEVIVPIKVADESVPFLDFGDLNSKPQSKKQRPVQPSKKSKRSRSNILLDTTAQPATLQCWWSAPDERAIIRFRNGNVYQGNISMKCMHGEGRFQWANGTIYLGDFKNNEITGRGKIQWNDDTWYEGEFLSNIRHGSGLYVDSRRQRSYMGGWHCGTKHGNGVIYYNKTFKNSYDGDWAQNVRHGNGIREYCAQSGYIGEWDNNVREGTGLMIWPNSDFYNGGWKNGVMSGKGVYIWEGNLNNTMSYPSINVYYGHWFRGMRNCFGILNLGYGMGSYYKGDFVDNKKHGKGKLVTNNGLIIRDYNQLFRDDNMTSLGSQQSISDGKSDPFLFNICDSSVGLLNHIEKALNNLERDKEIRACIVKDYLRVNKIIDCVQAPNSPEEHTYGLIDFVDFEESSLRKAIQCYSTELKEIYYTYATICNSKHIYFNCVMLRLYLWQLYFDCNIHEKGLTLVGIDRMFYQNRDWLANKPHDPFEKVYFWQFIHSLILVACKLYCRKTLPSIKPDTILASAFRHFMEADVLPAVGRRRGKLVNGYGEYIPLKHLYSLYRSIGEPHTIRKFLMCVRAPPHQLECSQPELIEASDDMLPIGRNVYLYGDQMSFVTEGGLRFNEDEYNSYKERRARLKLFNFSNLSSKLIISLFGHIFPQVFQNDKVLDLSVEITFFEFFEVLLSCIEESIRVKDEELRWREKFSTDGQFSTA